MARVNWTDVMAKGLASRRQFRPTGGGNRMARPPQPEDLVDRHARQAMQDAGVDMKQANVDRIRAGTELLPAESEARIGQMEANAQRMKDMGTVKALTPMEEANLKAKKLSNIELGLKNATAHLPSVTRDTYADYYNWITDTNFVPKGTFAAPEKVAGMSALEFKAYKSSLSGLQRLDTKGLALLEKKKAAELVADAKILAAEKTATDKKAANKLSKAQDLVTRLTNKFIEPENIPEKLRPAFDKAMELINAQLGVEELPPEDNRLAQQKVLDNMRADLKAAQGNAPKITPEVMQAFKAKYPDKTDEEILQAYSRLQQ